MMPELRPEAIELVEKVKTLSMMKLSLKNTYFMNKLKMEKIVGTVIQK